VGVEFTLTQRLQQRQADARRPMHSVKRFTTSACRISFRCQCDVIIDVSRLASFSERSNSIPVLGIYNVEHLAISTQRIQFCWNVIIGVSTLACCCSTIAGWWIEHLHGLQLTYRGKCQSKKRSSYVSIKPWWR